MDEEHETSALRARRKKSSMGLSCCFNVNGHRRASSFSFDLSSSSPAMPSPISRRSPSSWFRSKTPDVPEVKPKTRNFMCRVGRHRRHSSADFSYDPLSYALNFQDNDENYRGEEPLRSFTSRLPSSPPLMIASSAAMLSLSPRISELPFSRAEAVAEVRRNLQLSTALAQNADQVMEVRRSPEVPTSRKVVVASAEPRRSIERSTMPRAAVVAEVRRTLEDVSSPSVVVSRPSRQVLVELC